jgi:hypothetical protein
VTVQFWVGVAFAAAVLVFLFIAFYAAKNMSPGQWAILRFVSSLCAACAAAFILGEISVSYAGNSSDGGKLTVYATSGFGAFLLVWLTFPKAPPHVLPDGATITIPEGMSFKDAAFLIATQDKATAVFEGFKPEELATPLRGGSIEAKEIRQILAALGPRGHTAIPKYDVSLADAIYELRVKR